MRIFRSHPIKRGLQFICILLLAACSDGKDGDPHSHQEKSSEKTGDRISVDTIELAHTSIDTNSRINYTDQNGDRQGLWRDTIDNKVFIESHYLNNQLNGLRIKRFGAERHEQTYQNNKKEGIYKWYVQGDLTYTGMYSKDSLLWGVYTPDIAKNIIPVKGFHGSSDSVNMTLYYETGEKMYTGVVSKKSAYDAIGIHRYYYKNGEMKALINYDSLTIKKYKFDGSLDFNGSFSQWRLEPLQSDQ